MYDKVKKNVKNACGEETEDFTVNIGVHPGSELNPYLFSLVIDELTKIIQD